MNLACEMNDTKPKSFECVCVFAKSWMVIVESFAHQRHMYNVHVRVRVRDVSFNGAAP